jgi:hemerythrin-like metal-binding protein
MGDAANYEQQGNAARVEALDAEHEELMALMTKIIKRGTESALKAELFLLLRQLLTRTQQHFTHEEAYMRDTGYARLDTHQIMHAQLLEALRKHVTEFEAGDGALGPRVVTFLKFWLMTHMSGMDEDILRRPSPAPASTLIPRRKG